MDDRQAQLIRMAARRTLQEIWQSLSFQSPEPDHIGPVPVSRGEFLHRVALIRQFIIDQQSPDLQPIDLQHASLLDEELFIKLAAMRQAIEYQQWLLLQSVEQRHSGHSSVSKAELSIGMAAIRQAKGQQPSLKFQPDKRQRYDDDEMSLAPTCPDEHDFLAETSKDQQIMGPPSVKRQRASESSSPSLLFNLPALPTELIISVCDFLEPGDLVTIRQTSTRLEECSRNAFKRKFFQLERVVFSEKSLIRLIHIAHSSRITERQNHLTIDFHIPEIPEPSDLPFGYSHIARQLLAYQIIPQPGGGYWDLLDTPHSCRGARNPYMTPKLKDADFDLLVLAMKGFRRAGLSIDFNFTAGLADAAPYRVEEREVFSSLASDMLIRDNRRCARVGYVVQLALDSAFSAGVRLKSIGLQRRLAKIHPMFLAHPLKCLSDASHNAFETVTRLSLKIDNFENALPRYPTTHEVFEEKSVEMFIEFLSQAKNLETLEPDFDSVKENYAIGSWETRNLRDQFLRHFTASGLKRFELSSAWIDQRDLSAFLARHPSLEHLSLYQIILVTGSWATLLNELVQTLPDLRSLDLILISEKNDDLELDLVFPDTESESRLRPDILVEGQALQQLLKGVRGFSRPVEDHITQEEPDDISESDASRCSNAWTRDLSDRARKMVGMEEDWERLTGSLWD